MFVDEIWDFKSLNMGRELEIAGEFIYDSAKKMMSITGLNNQYEINTILYAGAVGIERLQKILLCLTLRDPTDMKSIPECLRGHNHLELEKELKKHTEARVTGNGTSLLGLYSDYYRNFRYANYIPGTYSSQLKKLFIRFLKKQNGKFDFEMPCAAIQFEDFKRFYINELGKLANHYFELIEAKAREIGTYTYEIDSFSNAARVFWSTNRRTLYGQMIMEQEAIKELLLFLYKNRLESGVFKLLNELDSIDLDDGIINECIADICEGKVNGFLMDYVEDLHNEIEDKNKRKERKDLLSLMGNRSVLFDLDDEEFEDEIE